MLAEDEAGLSSVPTVMRMWAPRGHQPKIPTRTAKRQRVTLFGAVNLVTGRESSAVADRGNSETFRTFLDQLVTEYPTQTLVILLDNVRFHHARTLKTDWFPSHPQVRFVFLPAYSPDLNPQEWVWKALRADVTHNTYYEDFADEVHDAEQFLASYCHPTTDRSWRII